MTQKEKQIELKEKVVNGLEKSFERLIAFKKEKNSDLVIMKGKEIVKVKPE